MNENTKMGLCDCDQIEVRFDDGDSEEGRASCSLYSFYLVNVQLLDAFSGEMDRFRLLKLINAVSHQKIMLTLHVGRLMVRNGFPFSIPASCTDARV